MKSGHNTDQEGLHCRFKEYCKFKELPTLKENITIDDRKLLVKHMDDARTVTVSRLTSYPRVIKELYLTNENPDDSKVCYRKDLGSPTTIRPDSVPTSVLSPFTHCV